MTRRRPKPVRLPSGPWVGCFDGSDVNPPATDRLLAASNMVFRNTQTQLAPQVRPGFAKLAQLGSGSDRTPQCVFQHTRLDGTEDAFAFVGGKMYRWVGGASFNDITPGTVTISKTARIFCTTFANLLIVTDGVNKPWQYDPATSTATVIEYDSTPHSWCAYGAPFIYDGALGFIVNTVNSVSMRSTFAWSEPGTPLVGYFQTDYDNTWTLAQTDADPLVAMVGTNAALYYWRPDSCGAITGAIGFDFRNSAQHDGVSTTVGTTSPGSVCTAGDYIWFIDRLGRPHRLRIGGEIDPVWQQLQDTSDYNIGHYGSTGTVGLERWAHTGYVQELGLIASVIWVDGTNDPGNILYMFDAESGVYAGTWSNNTGFDTFSVLGCLRDVNKRFVFFALCRSYTDATDGWAFAQNLMRSGGSTYYVDGSAQLTATVTTRQLAHTIDTELVFDRVDIEMAGTSNASIAQQVFFTYTTQRATSSLASQQMALVQAGTTPRAAFGINGRGRSISCTASIVTSTIDTPIPNGFNRLSVLAYPDANDPGVP